MKQKQLVAIAIACGVLCAACVAAFMVSVQGEAEAARSEALARYGGEQVEVCVATRDIVTGERVDLSAVETKLWVADLLPESAMRQTSDIVGKTATSPIFKGEVISAGRFEAGHDSLDVPAGKQAVSVPAKAVQAVGGAISSGMSVDIYSSGDTSTALLAQDVSVLDTSVGKSGSLTSGDNGWITLAIDPEKVQDLIAASNRTTLYFTLPGEAVQSGDAAQANGEKEGGSASSRSAASSQASANSAGSQSAESAQSSQSAQPASTAAASKSSAAASVTQGGDGAGSSADKSAQSQPNASGSSAPSANTGSDGR